MRANIEFYLYVKGTIKKNTKTKTEKNRSSNSAMSLCYVVEAIIMTAVTERCFSTNETNLTHFINIIAPTAATTTDKTDDVPKSTAGNEVRGTYLTTEIGLKPTSISAQITGILKGGKLWKNDATQVIYNNFDYINN